VLVGCQAAPVFYLIGWCTGAELLSKAPEERVAGRPSHFLYQGDERLHDCAELVDELPAECKPPPPEPDRYPDLQQWIKRYGGYTKIPWDEWDRAMEDAKLGRALKLSVG
jgi:hypothetical protein